MTRLGSYALVAAIGATATVGTVFTFLVLRSAFMAVGHTDFGIIYVSGDLIRRFGAGAPYNDVLARSDFHRLGVSPLFSIVYTPPLTWLGLLLAQLPERVAEVAWYLLLLGCLFVTWAVTRMHEAKLDALRLTMALATVPVAVGFQFGQPIFIVMGAAAGSYALLRRDQNVEAGLLLTLILVKPQIAFLVPVTLLVSGRVRAAVAFAGGALVVAAASFAALGLATARTYFTLLLGGAREGAPYLVAKGLTLSGAFGRPAGIALSLLVVAALGVSCWKRGAKPELPIAAGLLGSVLLTPFIHLQDLSVLLVAGWMLLRLSPAWPYVAAMIVVWIGLEFAGSSVGDMPTLLAELGGLALLTVFAVRSRAAPYTGEPMPVTVMMAG